MNTNTSTPSSVSLRKATALVLTGLCLQAAAAWGGVQNLVGRYEGAWTNTTFGSTSNAVIEIQITGSDAVLIFDMDGHVFGMMDPPLITMPGTVSGDVISIDNHGVGMFGDIKGSVDAAQNTFTATLTNIPGGFLQYVTAVGTIAGGVIALDYTVYFPGPPGAYNPAYGVMLTTKVETFAVTRVARQGTDLLLEWVGGQGPFQVQVCTNLSQGDWLNVGPQMANHAATVPVGTAEARAFYRVAGQ